MADLAIGISKAAVEALVNKVKTAIKEEEELWQAVQRDAVFMKDEFEMMQSFLKTADWEQAKNTMGRTWVRQVRDLSYDAEDNIESLLLLETKRSFWTFWRRFLASCYCNRGAPSPLEQAVAEIEILKARVEEVSSRNKRYILINDSRSMPQQLVSVPAIGSTAAVDILAQAWSTEQKLGGSVDLTMLVNESSDALQVISLWGTRGDLGVTSILKEAYEESVICQKFRARAWLKVAHPFDPHEFIQSLREQFYGNSSKDGGKVIDIGVLAKMERTDLVKEFVQELTKHRFLVVLESLSSMSDWQAIRTYLPDTKNGSRIVVSSQQLEIAKLCAGQSYQVSELRKLQDNHSICAFFNKGFKRVEAGVMYYGPFLQESAKSITLVGRGSDSKDSSDKKESSVKKESSDMKELSKLISSASRGDRPPVVSVWGFPGIGKSVLVTATCSLKEFNKESLFKLYADVSYPFNISVFCRRILSHTSDETQKDGVPRPGPEKKTVEELIQECTDLLKGRQCLLVIDGLLSKEDWNSIKQLIPEPSETSTIVVATAEESVARYCAVQDDSMYRVKALEPEHALMLFENSLKETITKKLREAGIFTDDAQMQKEAKNIVASTIRDDEVQYILAKCGGIPKVIVAVAEHLGSQQGDIQWKLSQLKANFIHELETNPGFLRLRDLFLWMRLKFDALPRCVRRCILYQSVFSEVKRVRVRPSHFVRRWIAEGYSKSTNSETMEEYTVALFNRFTQETASIGEWRVNSFFHEYINSRLMEERDVFFPLVVTVLDKSRSQITTEGLGQHLLIKSNWNRNEKFVFEDLDYSHLQSLTVHGHWKPFFIPGMMKSLRVLDLEGTYSIDDDDDDNLQKMLELVPRLRFLSLRGHREITHLPDSFSGLKHLQTLDIRGTSIVYIKLQKLQKLQYLRAGPNLRLMDDPSVADKETPLTINSGTLVSRFSKFLGCAPAGLIQRLKGSNSNTLDLGLGNNVSTSNDKDNNLLADEVVDVKEETTPSTKRSGSLMFSLFKFIGCRPAGPCNGIKKVTGGIRHLSVLHTLGAVNVNTEDGKGLLDEIRDLKQLKKLDVTGINRKNSNYLSKAILNQTNLESLSLQLEKENPVVHWEDISPPPRVRSLKLYGHVEKLSARRFNNLRNLRKLSLEMARALTQEDVERLGNVQSLITLRLRVNNDQNGELQFPAHLPVKKDKDGRDHVPDRLFIKLQVLEIASKSMLHVRFYEGAMQKLEVLKAHCWDDSLLHLHGLKHANSLKQVWLLGSYKAKDTLKERLQQKLARHPRRPALKL